MPSQSNKKIYLDDVFVYYMLMQCYFLFIGAGVGAGKSTLAKLLAQGKTRGQKRALKVLCLTSRTIAKLDMLNTDVFIEKLSARGNLFLTPEEWFAYMFDYGLGITEERLTELKALETEEGGRFNSPVCVTYAGFVNFIRWYYHEVPENDVFEWIWNVFDVVIMDEIHTVWSEASFQSSGQTIVNLIKWFANNKEKYPDKRVIFMSGTPKLPLDKIQRICGNVKVLDVCKTCAHVRPQKIMFVDSVDKYEQIEKNYLQGHKIIDFYNGSARSLMDLLCLCNFSSNDILSLTSKWNQDRDFWQTSRRRLLKETVRRMEYAEETMLEEGNLLPGEYRYIACTMAYGEAVTWNNEDFDFVYVDSVMPERVIQSSGRLRKADYVLVICTDSYQYEDMLAQSLAKIHQETALIQDFNNEYQSLTSNEERREFIEDVEEEHQGIVFDFRQGCFVPYALAVDSIKYAQQCIREWRAVDRSKLNCYHSIVKRWFPDVPIDTFKSKEYQSMRLFHDNRIEEKTPYTAKKTESLTEKLKAIWGDISTLNGYVKRFMPNMAFQKVYKGPHKGKYFFKRR